MLYYIVLYCILLYCIILYYIILYYIILYYIILYYIILYHIISYHISYHIISYHVMSFHVMSCHVMLYVMLCCIILYYIILYYIILYYIILYYIKGPPPFMRSVVDRNVVMRRIPAYCWRVEWFLNVRLREATTEETILHGIPEVNDRTMRTDGTLVKTADLDVSDTSSSSVKNHFKPFSSSSSYYKFLPISSSSIHIFSLVALRFSQNESSPISRKATES